MNNHWCAVCGHANSPGAEVCEACDSRLGDALGASAGEPDHANESSYAYGEAPHSTYGEEPHEFAPTISQRRFKGVGDVFGPTLEVYRKNFLLIIILVVAATVPAALLQYGLLQTMIHAPGDAFSYALAFAFIVWLLALLGSAILSGALVYAVMDLQTSGATSAGSSLIRALKTLPRVFLVQFIYGVIVFVGLLLLVVPGIILFIIFALAVPVAVVEGRGPFESLGRSVELTSGYRWLIFLTYFVWVVAVIIINWVIGGSFSYGAGLNPFAVVMLKSLVSGVLNSSTAVLTVFIYLGILNERTQDFDAHVFTPAER